MINIDDVINQVSTTNQKTIELLQMLTRSNTLLVEYVLTKEVEVSTNGRAQRHKAVLAELPMLPPPDISEEAVAVNEPKKRETWKGTNGSGRHYNPHRSKNYTVSPGTKTSMLTDFAQANGGVLDLREFRKYFERRKLTPPSFARTSAHGACKELCADGIMERTGTTTYKLIDPSRVPPLQKTESTRAPKARPSIAKSNLDVVIEFAKAHDWILETIPFLAWWAKHRGDRSPSYGRTTVFTDLNTMVAQGTARKLGKGKYEIIPK